MECGAKIEGDEFCLLGHNTIYLVDCADVSEEHVSSNLRIGEQAKQEFGFMFASSLFLLGLFLDHTIGDMFLRNIGPVLAYYAVFCPKRQNPS